ncbi:MAG: hypothetical protein Q8O40_11635 [Chloroflexota bacterium]|nr:hypothetical protein [Chloroflexota bacterium]
MQVPFSELFQVNEDGTLTSKVILKADDHLLRPGDRIGRSAILGGIRLAGLAGQVVEVEKSGEVHTLTKLRRSR